MTGETKPYPVTVTGELSIPPGQWVWLFKWLLLIPHYVVLGFLYIGVAFVWIISFFAILFTARYPRGLFNYMEGVLRWSWRIGFYSYQALGTDKYPPFSLASDPSYPADLHIEYPTRLSRGLVLIKWWLLAIPQYIVAGILGASEGGGLISILSIFAGIMLLFTGKYPQEIFKLVIGMNRWTIRVSAYAMLMRDEYPPFRLWDD